MRKIRTGDITKMALCVAVLGACAWLVIPLPFTPVVLSLHTLALNITGLVLKPKQAFFAVLVYLLMGLIGLPVFAGGTAGPGKLFGPTGGFYFGFLIAAVLISLLKGKKIRFGRYALVTIGVGMPIQHLFAILFLCFYNGFHVGSAVLSVSLPFLPGDMVKGLVSAAAASAINRGMLKSKS